MGRAAAILSASMLALLAGCGGSAGAGTDQPSPTAQMVCAEEAQRDIAAALGVTPTRRPASTWADHVFSCRYQYPDGTITLSVQELADATATAAYLAAARSHAAGAHDIPGLGEEAFTVADGSAYVRKDFKVLFVDVSALPVRFGQPPRSRVVTALTVATVIMACWTGD